jgi:asparagine synthase (glutamine-hydrolysing)
MTFSNLIKPNEPIVYRDSLGNEPVYYYASDSEIVIASSIKEILKQTKMTVEVDLDALNEYFTFQNIFSDRTLFKGIKLLPPGHLLSYANGELNKELYYDIPTNKVEMKEKEWEGLVEKKLEESVNRLNDDDTGSFLSGGLDSASVAYMASKDKKIKTFTMGFDVTTAKGIEQTFDERVAAEEVSRLIGSEHYEMVLHSGDMISVLPELIYHLEDLRVGMSYPNYYAMRLASKYVKNVFSGEGGDELFGGYPWRHELASKCTPKNFELKYYDYWTRLVPKSDKPLFFNHKVNTDDPFEQYMKIMQKSERLKDPVERMMYFDAKTFMPACAIVDSKYAKANGINLKSPFADVELANVAFLMPHKYKYKDGQSKYLLRKIMSKYLPVNIINKKKQGFSAPDMSWYQCESLNYIKKLLMSEDSMSKEYINQKYIGKVILEHSAGLQNHRLLLWSLMSFEWWCRIFLGRTYADRD